MPDLAQKTHSLASSLPSRSQRTSCFRRHSEDTTRKSKMTHVNSFYRACLKYKMRDCPSQLSEGRQRRVAIVRAFIKRSEISLADEPAGDLDEKTAQVTCFF